MASKLLAQKKTERPHVRLFSDTEDGATSVGEEDGFIRMPSKSPHGDRASVASGVARAAPPPPPPPPSTSSDEEAFFGEAPGRRAGKGESDSEDSFMQNAHPPATRARASRRMGWRRAATAQTAAPPAREQRQQQQQQQRGRDEGGRPSREGGNQALEQLLRRARLAGDSVERKVMQEVEREEQQLSAFRAEKESLQRVVDRLGSLKGVFEEWRVREAQFLAELSSLTSLAVPRLALPRRRVVFRISDEGGREATEEAQEMRLESMEAMEAALHRWEVRHAQSLLLRLEMGGQNRVAEAEARAQSWEDMLREMGVGGGMEMAAHSERLVGVREELYVDMGPAASAAVASAVNKLVSRGGLLSVHNRLRLARGNPVLRDQGVDPSLPLHQLMDRLHPKLRLVLVGSEATRSRFASLVAAVAQQDIKTGRTQRTQFAADHIFQARNVDEELDSFRTLTVTEGGHIVERAALDAERDGARERDNSRILPAYLREVARHWRDAGLGEWRLPLLRDPRTSVRISGVVSPRDTGVGERRERKGVCVLREVKE